MATDFIDIYRRAHRNAAELLHDAKALFERRSYPRAYALAFTALEELSKSQFAADVFTGLHTEGEFQRFFRRHDAKLLRMGWAHADASEWPHNLKWIGPDRDDMKRIDPAAPTFERRQQALYVDVDLATGTVSQPSEVIGEKEAEEMIHIVDVALTRIWEVEESQGRIGTKGFLK
jgi:AbiV family abortive infection protein